MTLPGWMNLQEMQCSARNYVAQVAGNRVGVCTDSAMQPVRD